MLCIYTDTHMTQYYILHKERYSVSFFTSFGDETLYMDPLLDVPVCRIETLLNVV